MRLGLLRRLRGVFASAYMVVSSGLVFAASAVAGEAPIVRMEILPGVVLVGESVELRVTVLAPTWFPKPPVYPSFELPNAMTRLPADSSYPISEQVGSETWSGIVRSYEIIPLIAATYQLEDKAVTVTWTDLDSLRPQVRAIDLPDSGFRAVVPAGAEALDPYLAGRRLTIKREIEGGSDGETREHSVGDAVVVHYTAELEGMAAIFIPPLFSNPRAEGAAVYATEAIVEEHEIARRMETLTFVLEKSGEFIVPGVEVEWWNTRTDSIETASVQELSLPVRGVPLSIMKPGNTRRSMLVGISFGGIGLVVLAGRRWLPWLRARHQMRVKRHLRSEAHAFSELVSALRLGEARAIHRALLAWLARLQPGLDVRGFVLSYGDSGLGQGVESMIATVYADLGGRFDAGMLEAGLRAARQNQLRCRVATRDSDLPPLNR